MYECGGGILSVAFDLLHLHLHLYHYFLLACGLGKMVRTRTCLTRMWA